ncbi:MAG: methanol--corrinoid methyltransferase [Verrucomicrobia bacterium]|nr:methanol--corrinoid methyltransferase [Verrucomicrobiota bacterium]
MKYQSLAIDRPESLVFGSAPHPLATRSGMVIGGGCVYPELNFTLPPMEITADTMPRVLQHYREIIRGALERAAELESDGVVVEFETLPPMTENPDWGMAIIRELLNGMDRFNGSHGLKSVLRVTPNDNREFFRPPVMRSGYHLDRMIELFERAAAEGAELLSIESVGGKELHDDALIAGDIASVIFSLCCVGARDMRFLWTEIVRIAGQHGAVAAGDTACGFGNTAMVLAEQKMIPRVFAAVVRAVTAVRSLVAYECGAVGPGKDCGYENPFLKAITGFPMAMEGKSAACAHLSPLGNIAAATCDTWSNESVQNIKLLGGMAPTCYMEQLIYDCRMMNAAIGEGSEGVATYQRWAVGSDARFDPQAYILAPVNVIRIANAVVGETNHYRAGCSAALAAVDVLKDGMGSGQLRIPDRERIWLDTIGETVAALPEREDDFIAAQLELADPSKFLAAEYGL